MGSDDPLDPVIGGEHGADTKEDLFRQRFVALVAELATPGAVDAGTMTAIGAIARRVMDDTKVMSWSAFKRSQTREDYDGALRAFDKQGNAMVGARRFRTAYAIQVLAMSLIARTQADAAVQEADHQLDGIIDFAAAQRPPTSEAPN